MQNYRKCLTLLILFTSINLLFAQGRKEDYQRASSLRGLTANKVYRSEVKPKWLADGNQFWYKAKTGPDSYEYVIVDAAEGKRSLPFDHKLLATLLVQNGVKDAKSDKLPITNLRFKNNSVEFYSGGKSWKYDVKTSTLSVISDTAESNGDNCCHILQRIPSASRRTGNEINLIFVNKTDNKVQLFWLNTDGKRINYGTIPAGGRRQQNTFAGHIWLVVDENDKVIAAYEAPDEDCVCAIDGKNPPSQQKESPREDNKRSTKSDISPDGKWKAFVRDYNLYLRDESTKEEFKLTEDGTKADFYTTEFYWSPDSLKLVAVKLKKGDDRKVYLIESSPQDQLQPKLHSINYLKPGDKVDIKQPCLFIVKDKRQIKVNNTLFPNPYSITQIRWWKDSRAFVFLYNQRGHQKLCLFEVNATNGNVRPLIEETSDTFIDYNGKFYLNILEDSGEIIWMSERDGWNHLYLYDIQSGKVKKQITKGDWVVRSVDFVDTTNRHIWFFAGGIKPEQDPYYLHLCRINFNESGFLCLTDGDGTHEVQFSPDRKYLIDTYSRVDLPPITELRSAIDGRKICELEKANWDALLKTGWKPPERFVAKGRDGITDIYGIIIKPINFDPSKKYPIIEHIYAGPQSAFVPKKFQSFYEMQTLAELGFILVQIDGMGTSHRSKIFHSVCYKNLADAGFPDRKLWIKAAAKERPWMDITRVGIYGGSAGGQNAARALIDHNDFYKAAAADCGCHDNRMDKLWWNELWMGYPVGPHYAEQSNVTGASKLKGKLLLTVGELDNNVDPSSTMQVVNALIKAGKDFDMLIIPGAGHGAGDSPYGKQRRAEFFVRNLLEPRS